MRLPEPFQNSLILTGPTASGKSSLALELAESLHAEIVAMDSMTIYKAMDIGTAKPGLSDRQRVPHHLIDILEPWESGNVAWWLQLAECAVRDIESRGKKVLFVGGTPFYLKALLQGLFAAPTIVPEIRQRLETEAAEQGSLPLHQRLRQIDTVAAARIHPNDTRRVVRALEVWHSTGMTLTEWQQQEWWDNKEDQKEPDTETFCAILDIPRPILYERIDRRVLQMFENGWIDEVKNIMRLPKPWSKEASRALGYQEIIQYLGGIRSLEETIALVQLRTRQFAKRQMTWFRSLPGTRIQQAKLTFSLWREKIT